MVIKNSFEATEKPIVSEKKSGYVLVLPDKPVSYEVKAAEEFNLLLRRATGAEIARRVG